jgi:hypothetical protein
MGYKSGCRGKPKHDKGGYMTAEGFKRATIWLQGDEP